MQLLLYIVGIVYIFGTGIFCMFMMTNHLTLYGENPSYIKVILYLFLSLFWPLIFLGAILANYTQTFKKK